MDLHEYRKLAGEFRRFADHGRRLNEYRGKCQYPGCHDDAIKSHAIQAGRILRSMSRNGEVVCLKYVFPEIRFEPEMVGLKRITTFYGFCSRHDRDVFACLETRPLDLSNRQHSFLVCYRSMVKRHCYSIAAIEAQRRLLSEAEKLPFGRSQILLSGLPGLQEYARANAFTGRAKEALDSALTGESWESVTSRTCFVKQAHGVLAEALLEPQYGTPGMSYRFFVDGAYSQGNHPWALVTVLPVAGETAVTVHVLKEWEGLAAPR